jgi:SAM-dependent methyltransferase
MSQASAVASQTNGTNLLRKIWRGVPRPVKEHAAFIYRGARDAVDVVLARRQDLVPARRLSFVGAGDFVKIGDEFFGYFVEFCDLRPEHAVLDVGSGIGRMARPLTKFLTSGSYAGIDIVPRGIEWCQRHITSRYPNFSFQHADVYNQEYNPTGTCQPGDFRFPFADESFDFVFLTSVFTHMLPNGMQRYLSEAARCLRPGGKCLITFFLLNEESRMRLSAGQSSMDFKFPAGDGCWMHDRGIPEFAIAYDEATIRSRYDDARLIVRALKYGSWCGRAEYLSYQDILIAEKVG